MAGNNEDRKQDLPEEHKPELVGEFPLCPVCSLRKLLSSLIKLLVSYERTPSQAETHALKGHLLKLQEELDMGAHPGTDWFAETLGKEAKKKGHMAPDYEYYTVVLQGPVRQASWENKIPYGATIRALWVGTDVCMNCGAMCGLKMVHGFATKPATLPEGKQPPPGSGLYRGKG